MGKKKSTFKNIMVTLGCTVFAGVYALGGGYAAYKLLGGTGTTQPAWLDRVEIHVDEQNASGGVTEASNNNPFDFGKVPQKPRFEEKEEETETTDETETESEAESETDTALETQTDPEAESETEADAENETNIDIETEMESDTKEASGSKKKKPVEVEQVQVIEQDEKELAVLSDVTAVVKAAMPCVVSITNEYTAYDYWYDEEYDERANGSGIVVAQSNEEILIVTNYHVIQDNNNLYVQFIDDREAMAYVKGTSPENDLAIVSVFLDDMSDKTLRSISIAALGDSDSLQVGEPAIAIGNSLGYGQSVTTGVISALNRNVFEEDLEMNNQGYLIQTDAAINPGNSGGALLNVKGEVVGINSSKIADYVIEGMGYAIPISTAKPIIEELMLKETRKKVPAQERAFLGVAGTDVIEEATARYEMPEGVFVTNVLEDTAAEKAGILKGDIITYIDGEKITGMDELQGLLEYYAGDTEVEVVLMRLKDGEYKERTIEVILEYKED